MKTNFENQNLANNKMTFENEIINYPKKDDCFASEIDKDVYVAYDIAENKSFKNFSAKSFAF